MSSSCVEDKVASKVVIMHRTYNVCHITVEKSCSGSYNETLYMSVTVLITQWNCTLLLRRIKKSSLTVMFGKKKYSKIYG